MLFDAWVFRASLSKPHTSAGADKKSLRPERKKRILVVEPDLLQADLISSHLLHFGYDVAIAGDGNTCLTFIGDTSPDLILLATHLRDMTGYELTEILRASGQYSWRLRHVHILYLTERDRVVNHRLVGAPESEVQHYLFKPIIVDELREKVERALIYERTRVLVGLEEAGRLAATRPLP